MPELQDELEQLLGSGKEGLKDSGLYYQLRLGLGILQVLEAIAEEFKEYNRRERRKESEERYVPLLH